MKTAVFVVLTVLLEGSLYAGILKVGPGETYSTVQSAIDAAVPGDTVEIAAGNFAENLVVNKSPLTILGARNGVDARGRIAGVPNPALETIITPTTGTALSLTSGDGAIVVSGCFFESPPSLGSGVIEGSIEVLQSLDFRENHVRVEAGAQGAAFSMGTSAIDATLSKNVFEAAAGSVHTLILDGTSTYDGFHLIENEILRVGAVAHHGLFVDGNRNLGTSALRSSLIHTNSLVGHEIGFFAGARSLDGVIISGNRFQGNVSGMVAGPKNCDVTGNQWLENSRCALELTGGGELVDASYGAQGGTIKGNAFWNNGTLAGPGARADLIISDQAPGTLGTIEIKENSFGSLNAIWNNEIGDAISAGFNYWGTNDGPSGFGPGGGSALLGSSSTEFRPFYTDGILSDLDFDGVPISTAFTLGTGDSISGDTLTISGSGSLTVTEGAEVAVTILTIQGGAQVLVRQGAISASLVDLGPSGILDVLGGELSLDPTSTGQFHTIGGTFTLFDSLGSMNINGDTNFSGSALCLVSQINVASGVDIDVLGELQLDGCVLECPGSFNLVVEMGAKFDLRRSDVSGALISLVGNDVTIRDNLFQQSQVIVSSSVAGVKVYHNIFEDGLASLTVSPGAVATTSMEGWGNVTGPLDVENVLTLNFKAPTDLTRTQDSEGRLYTQPGDSIEASLDLLLLNSTTQAVETRLGFSTEFLAFDDLQSSPEWPIDLYEFSDESNAVGRLDSTVGLRFDYPDPDGSMDDGEVALLQFLVGTREGKTQVFFRSGDPTDVPVVENRLTVSSSGIPEFRNTPFTQNSGMLIVDGTIPVVIGGSAFQDQNGSPVDVLNGASPAYRGTVSVSFEALDLLAGIDDADVSLLLTNGVESVNGVLLATIPVNVGGEIYTQFQFDLEIGNATPNGIYQLSAQVMDRSGNSATLDLGPLEVSLNEITTTVALQGLVTTALTREIVFVASDAGGSVVDTWVIDVDFLGGEGSVVLGGVPETAAFLSAKSAWNLRVRKGVSFDVNGFATMDFSGSDTLPGGDFNGDNFVNLFDYNILRSPAFPRTGTVADLSGDGGVNLFDFLVFRSNWLTGGDSL